MNDASGKPVNVPAGDERLEMALFSLGYQNQIAAIAGTFVLSGVIAAAYHETLPPVRMWGWLAWMFAVGMLAVLIRWSAWRTRRRGKLELAFARRWRQQYLLQSMLLSLGWGNIGLLYRPNAVAQNAVLLVVFLGVAASATNSAASHHLKMVLFGIGIAFLFQLAYLPHGFGEHALPMQIMLMLYLLVLFNGARNINCAVLESIRLRYENEAMLQLRTQEAKRADQANHDKSLFLAAASHDLRQPVHALLLLVAALRQRCQESAQLELIGHIQQAGQAIGKLFNALMELSRLESGSEKPEPADLWVAEALRQTVERHRLESQQKGLRLKLFISRGAAHAIAYSDRVLLQRVVDNLISNAIRYTAHGGVLISLRLRQSGQLWLDVRDSGIGIAAGDLGRIFEPYFQVSNAERDRTRGLGLGLAIVRQTSRLLGCEIGVASRLGYGTRFRLTLHAIRHEQPIPEKTAAGAEPPVPQLAGQRILVVDDDPLVRQAMQILLGSWQADLRCAHDAEECLHLLQDARWEPDCIICDYRLPGAEDGIALLNRLVDRYPDAVALLQTGELNPQVRDMAEDAGYMVLTKPVPADLLATTLKAVMRLPVRAPAANMERP